MPGAEKPQPSPFTQEVGRILAAALVRRGLSPHQLMEPLGISRSQVSRMLNGHKHWDLDQLDRACRFLGLDPVDVIAEADKSTLRRHIAKPSLEDARRAAAIAATDRMVTPMASRRRPQTAADVARYIDDARAAGEEIHIPHAAGGNTDMVGSELEGDAVDEDGDGL